MELYIQNNSKIPTKTKWRKICLTQTQDSLIHGFELITKTKFLWSLKIRSRIESASNVHAHKWHPFCAVDYQYVYMPPHEHKRRERRNIWVLRAQNSKEYLGFGQKSDVNIKTNLQLKKLLQYNIWIYNSDVEFFNIRIWICTSNENLKNWRFHTPWESHGVISVNLSMLPQSKI